MTMEMRRPRLRVGLDACPFEEKRTGVGNYLFNLMSEMRELNPPIDFFLYSRAEISADGRSFGEVREHVGHIARSGPLWMNTGLNALIARDDLDIFWGTNGYIPFLRQGRTKYIVTIHDLVHLFARHTITRETYAARRIVQSFAARRADAVTTVSDATAADIRKHHGRTADLILHPRMERAFNHPVDADDLRRLRERFALPQDFLLVLGTLEPRKNVVTILRAYRSAIEAGYRLPRLVVAGAKGWRSREIEEIVDDLVRQDLIQKLDFVPQDLLPALYAACSLFLFLPIYEGFGMPLREALMCGATALASDIPSLREAGGAAATYIPHDQASIEAALRAYAADPAVFRGRPAFALAREEKGQASDFLRLIGALTAERVS